MLAPYHTKDPPTRRPLVLVPTGLQERSGLPYQVMTHKYIVPLFEFSECVPLLIPTCLGLRDLAQYLDMADGIYLTGASSNINPQAYGQENHTLGKLVDHGRDHFDISLIQAALNRDLPFFGVCRGMQELNVALGGSLHQKVHELPGYQDHRDHEEDLEAQYGPRHSVKLLPQTWLARLMQTDTLHVNSLHGQGLDRLGQGIEPLAYAEDGLVEAVHMPDRSIFTLGVQWHPEWKAAENPDAIKLYQAFGQACRERLGQALKA